MTSVMTLLGTSWSAESPARTSSAPLCLLTGDRFEAEDVMLGRGSEDSGRVAPWPVAGDDARGAQERDDIPQRRGES
jgi:hypothetical protein